MSNLYFLDLSVKRRVDGIDNEMQHIEKENYLSDSIIERTVSLLPLVNVVLTNISGRYLITLNIINPLAKVKLFVDGNYLEFDGYFSGIISGTSISITSDIVTAVEATLIKQA